jgi:FkbH-like protein
VGEDGSDGIKIPEPYAALQDYAVAQQAKGILICLASKNTEADVLEVLAKRSDMRLKAQHIVAHRINWRPKPANLRSLAEELNLGLDSFVFLDDNPVECAQMQAEIPQVVTIQVPTGAEIPRLLAHLWNFDKLATTAEDANRTRMYRENSARRAMESAANDINQFISALNIEVDIAAPSEDEWARVEQLTQRTNQFNFSTRRWTSAELKSSLKAGAQILRVRVSDRFGDYGLVGAIIAWPRESELLVDTLLLSCRVLGRGVEHAMVRRLGEIALEQGLAMVSVPFVATARNIPAHAFAESIAAEFKLRKEGGADYRIPSELASRIQHRPGHDPAEIIEARISDEKKSAGKGSVSNGNMARSERYSRLANVLISGRAVLDQMSLQVRRSRQTDRARITPDSPLETELLRIWEDVLATDGLGVDDDYFELGGTSLLSVKLFAEIERRFGTQLRLTAILEAPTVRSLAQLIAPSAVLDRHGMVCLKTGGDRKFFLVHDGFGETLLYLNLARRLPPSMAVYGIEPRRVPGIPLAHASIEEMAEFYVEQIREIQPHGPYLLGGMCAGGVIAYEMAACLTRKNERVQLVTILDGATPHAAKRVGRILRNRLSRIESTLAQGASTSKSDLARWASVAATLARKLKNTAFYELSSALEKQSVRLRFLLHKMIVRRNGKWPAAVKGLSVMQIYNSLESRYHPPPLTDVPVLLIRASSGEGVDTPYRDIYRDEDFGWSQYAARLEIADVSGGHSSMLQEREVQLLTTLLLRHLNALPVGTAESVQ